MASENQVPVESSDNYCFIEHVNTIQTILDDWVTALDSKRYHHQIPNPLAYLSLIVLGEEQSGKTSFIQHLLGIPLKLPNQDFDQYYMNMNSMSRVFDYENGSQPYSKETSGLNYANNEISQEPYNISKIKSMYEVEAKTPKRMNSCYVTQANPSFGSLASRQRTSPMVYKAQCCGESQQQGTLSPRSSNSTMLENQGMPYSGMQSVFKKQSRSSLPLIITSKRGSDSCKISIPVRKSILTRVLTPECIEKLYLNQLTEDFNEMKEHTGIKEISLDSVYTLNISVMLLHLESTFGNIMNYSYYLNPFRVVVEHGDIIESTFCRGKTLEKNGRSNRSSIRRRSAMNPVSMNRQLNKRRSSVINIQESQELSGKSFGRRPSIPPLGYVGKRTSIIQEMQQQSNSIFRGILEGPNEISFIELQLDSTRFLPHLLTFAKFFELLVDFSDTSISNQQSSSLALKDEVIEIEISSSRLPNMRIIEMPSIPSEMFLNGRSNVITSSTLMDGHQLLEMQKARERVKCALRTYALDRTSLFVTVIDASQTLESYSSNVNNMRMRMPDSLRWIVELEPQGTRSMIVLSKIDLVNNLGRLLTQLLKHNLPWEKDYERRAASMFYKRYLSHLNVDQQKSNMYEKNFMTKNKDASLGNDIPVTFPRKGIGYNRLSFKDLGLHYPRVVGISFLYQNRLDFNGFAYDVGDIQTMTSELFLQAKQFDTELFSKYTSIMSNQFYQFFGYAQLVKSLITTVCMTVGAQCLEPAAILLKHEKKRLEQKFNAESERLAIASPSAIFSESLQKFRESIRSFFLKTPEATKEWIEKNNIHNNEELKEHIFVFSAPLFGVLSISAEDVEKKIISLNDNVILNEYYRKNLNKTSQIENDVSHKPSNSMQYMAHNAEDNLISDKTRIIIDYLRIEIEKLFKRCSSYLRTFLQSSLRASFNLEVFSENQLLAAEGIIIGMLQTHIVGIIKEIRLRCEMLFSDVLNRFATTNRHKLINYDHSDYNNILKTYQKHWLNFTKETLSFILNSFIEFEDMLLMENTKDHLNESNQNEWLNSLKRIFLSDTFTKTHNSKIEQLMIKLGLIRQTLNQMDVYIERYPLLYHLCVASVTSSQVKQQAMDSATEIGDYTAMEENDKLTDKLAQDSGILSDKNDRSTLLNAKTLSYICSGSIGAALLYSLAKK